MKDSAIQWTDHTFNPWIGCTKVAPECKNCYAETLMDKRWGKVRWGHSQPRVRTRLANWRQPLKWNDENGPAFRRARVFCLSLGDWLDDEVPIEWLADLLGLIHQCQNLDWQLLTKRPQNWLDRMCKVFELAGAPETYNKDAYTLLEGWLSEGRALRAPENVWIGVSAGADQKAALDIPSKVHFLSCEPMLHDLDLNYPQPFQSVAKFDWIIFGGESGPNARPCHVDWIRYGLAFCRANKIAAFVKQLGVNIVGTEMDRWVTRVRDSHGGNMAEWPRELQVREFPIS